MWPPRALMQSLKSFSAERHYRRTISGGMAAHAALRRAFREATEWLGEAQALTSSIDQKAKSIGLRGRMEANHPSG